MSHYTPSRRRLLRDSSTLALGGGALGLLGPAGRLLAQDNRILQWGSSSLGSTGYVIITVLAAAVSRFTDLRNSALSTAGGAENMALLGEGIIDFGQTTATDWQPALTGTGRYEGAPVEAQQMFSYTIWNISPMVPADSGIESLEDLKGKRVMPAAAGGATTGLWKTLFEAAGLYDEVEWTYGSWNETYNAARTGAADCIPILLTNGRPSPRVTELEAAMDMRVLPLSEELLQKANELNPGVGWAVVKPGSTEFVSEPTLMVSFAGILAAHPRIDEDTAYTICKAVFENAEYIREQGVQLQDVSLEFATRHLIPAYPVHPGAARYFKEQGVWRDDLTVAGEGA